ncbi:MAG: type II toxin-antitoxin system RelE/ParE family toxin [Acinetobacter junii]
MSSFDIFCQHFCLKNAQNQESHTLYKALSLDSKFTNMKELRVQHRGKPLRAFFTFNPLRQAIVLCIADKGGKKRFYTEMLAIADQQYELHLSTLGEQSNG